MYFPTGETEGMLWVKSFTGQGQMNLPLFGYVCHPPVNSTEFEGRLGAPPRPECRPHGYLTRNNTCDCWDNTIYKGVRSFQLA